MRKEKGEVQEKDIWKQKKEMMSRKHTDRRKTEKTEKRKKKSRINT